MVGTPMNNYALMRLLSALSECEPATSAVIAQDSGVELTTVREGLAALMERGIVQPASYPHRSVGRPPICYSLTCKGRELAPIMLDALRRLEAACA
jgi:predicted ArsR family transcriptional regulator